MSKDQKVKSEVHKDRAVRKDCMVTIV